MIGSLSIYLVPLASLGCSWGAIGLLWPDFGLPFAPFGSHWGTLKLPLAVLWAPLAGLWGRFGPLWGPVGSLRVGMGSPGLSPSNSLKCGRHFPAQCSPFAKSPGILPRLPAAACGCPRLPAAARACLRKWCQELLLRPHLHTRRGPG